ncbi:hypothetical protein [Sphingobacterium wenxiniae]|uniref:Uncharacterized protein n=1 Tax=Sphingobacterium wenxiniae TaxID=683125 RepID=A0A1I6THX9_9SPHI|nr:hypothetical protein [Sphingobacterium wenxiniae]SFS88766.1 hypothetical protein SAMN05660206_106159 [Sphingobacterium wenxiniae]
MKKQFNLWRVMAAAAVMLSAGVGYVGATSTQVATHYNTTPTDAEDQTPNWETIVPGGAGSATCTPNPNRPCKAILDSNNEFQEVQRGNYPGL